MRNCGSSHESLLKVQNALPGISAIECQSCGTATRLESPSGNASGSSSGNRRGSVAAAAATAVAATTAEVNVAVSITGRRFERLIAEIVVWTNGRNEPLFRTPSTLQLIYQQVLNSLTAIEGGICAGKTYLLKLLMLHVNEVLGNDTCVVLFETPASVLLNDYYRDRRRYALTLQLDMLRQRQAINQQALALVGRKDSVGNSSGKPRVVFTDRGLGGDIIFAIGNHMADDINNNEWEIYASVIRSGGSYIYDRVVLLDTSPERAKHICDTTRQVEKGIELEYLQKLRMLHYVVFRAYATSREHPMRIIYIYNEPWIEPQTIMDRQIRAPSFETVRHIWEQAPELDVSATPQQIDQAFSIIRAGYDKHYSA